MQKVQEKETAEEGLEDHFFDFKDEEEAKRCISMQETAPSKRTFDLVVAGSMLVLLTPLLVLIALYIKLVSKGPALYIQPRVGIGGDKFRIYKFRTMHDRKQDRDETHRDYIAELAAGNKVVEKPDIRSELIFGGRLLRSLSLDELPQLINVLKGEMSLVGPRPDLLDVNDYTIEQLRRFEVLPGITGLWQINKENALTFNDMIDLDIEYVDTQTLLLDLKITFLTAFSVLKSANS